MEHRWHRRAPVNLTVDLRYGECFAPRCLVRDAGLEGMYVETRGVLLPRGGVVEVVFSRRGDSDDPHKAVRALVIHSGRGGAGLLLAEPNVELRGLCAREIAEEAASGQGMDAARAGAQPTGLISVSRAQRSRHAAEIAPAMFGQVHRRARKQPEVTFVNASLRSR